MSKSSLNSLLVAVLAVSALTSVGLCFKYISNARQFRALNTQMSFINQRMTAVQALAADAVEYSKRNPAIDPILETIGAKPKSGQPASKPGAK